MTLERAAKMVGVLLMYYPGTEVSEETIKAYAMALSGVEESKALKAVPKIIAECKFFPSINEILRCIIEVDSDLPPPEVAWAEVMEQIRAVGSYGRPHFSCDEIAEAVRAVGWLNICLSETPGVERAHFLRTYEVLRDRKLKAQMASMADEGLTKALSAAWEDRKIGGPPKKVLELGGGLE